MSFHHLGKVLCFSEKYNAISKLSRFIELDLFHGIFHLLCPALIPPPIFYLWPAEMEYECIN